MPVSIPYEFTPEQEADANELNADIAALASKFDAGIVNGDISPAAAIDGNKMSQASGQQIPTAAMATNAVDSRVLASDAASPGSDAARAVSGDHVKAWTAAQFQRIVAALSILAGQLKTAIYTNAGSIVVAGNTVVTHTTTVSTTGNVPLSVYFLRVPAATLIITPALYSDAGFWKIHLYNPEGVSRTINANELKLQYVAAS